MKLFSLALGVSLAATVATAQEFMVAGLPDGYLNLRAGPGTQYRVLLRLFPEDEVSYVEERGNWLKVRLRNGDVGWASEKYLGIYTNYDGNTLVVQQTSDGFLNLREGPGADREIKGRLYPRDRVINYARSGAWVRVQNRRGDFGWVHSKYLGQ